MRSPSHEDRLWTGRRTPFGEIAQKGKTLKMVYLVAGARPNFMKIAPIVRALQVDGRLRYKLIHTGQHYDRDMNDVFFEEFGIPVPDVFMGLGGGSHAEQRPRSSSSSRSCASVNHRMLLSLSVTSLLPSPVRWRRKSF